MCTPAPAPPTVTPGVPTPDKESDITKNIIDLYKVCSEELRHTANIVWQFTIAILTFQGVALTLALKEKTNACLLFVIVVGVISIALSAMLVRQAHDRSCHVERIK